MTITSGKTQSKDTEAAAASIQNHNDKNGSIPVTTAVRMTDEPGAQHMERDDLPTMTLPANAANAANGGVQPQSMERDNDALAEAKENGFPTARVHQITVTCIKPSRDTKLGIRFSKDQQGRLFLSYIHKRSSLLANTDLTVGMHILRINGINVQRAPLQEAVQITVDAVGEIVIVATPTGRQQVVSERSIRFSSRDLKSSTTVNRSAPGPATPQQQEEERKEIDGFCCNDCCFYFPMYCDANTQNACCTPFCYPCCTDGDGGAGGCCCCDGDAAGGGDCCNECSICCQSGCAACCDGSDVDCCEILGSCPDV